MLPLPVGVVALMLPGVLSWNDQKGYGMSWNLLIPISTHAVLCADPTAGFQ